MEKLQIISSSFGELLKGYRKRKRLTQQQVAQQLGVHKNTVSSWELGTYLPATRGLVLELAHHLEMNELETRQFLEASLTALSPYWYVPFPRNPFFTGRAEVLKLLHRSLCADQVAAFTRSYALYGLGGVGKTQVALEYAYQHALEYSAIFWIGAESSENIVTSLLRIAEALQLPEREDKDQKRVLTAVQQWLSTHSRWLLIWDNVEDLDLIDRFLPSVRQGAILITTRCQAFGTLAQGLKLESMESEEGILLLLRRAKVAAFEAGDGHIRQYSAQTHPASVAAATLVKVLGGLPLALDQAAAYLEETGCSLSDYLSLYEREQARMLDRRGNAGRDHPQSVMATLRLSLEQVDYEQHVSADLLRVCALLHADAIPEEVFVEGAVYLGPALAPLASDPVLFNAAIAVLRRFSLVARQAEAHVLSLHRLVQTVLQASLPEAELQIWKARVIGTISHLFPANEEAHPDYFQRCERLLPHAQACLSWEKQKDETVSHRIALLTHVAAYLLRRSRLSEAESLYQQACIEAEHVLEPDHLLLADTFEGLADLRTLLAQYEEAEFLYQRALHIREQAFGSEHLQVAASCNGLGMLYWRQGKYSEAASLHQRALDIRRRALGADHPQVANALSQLAMIWRVQGKYVQAESLYLQALQLREHVFGLADPQMGLSFYHLAALYLEQARYEEARRFFVRAIHIWEESLGPEDLDLAFAFTGLATVLGEQGCYEEAETLFLRALRTREPVLGTDHPQIAVVLHGLANLFQKQQKYVQAEQRYQQALSIQEKYLGQQHTDTAETLHDFALLRQRQGNLAEALSLAEKSHVIRLRSLGDAHPKTVASRVLTAQLIHQHRQPEKGESSQAHADEAPDGSQKAGFPEKIPASACTTADAVSERELFQEFLCACCELHPRAWSRASDLWRTYEQWTAKRCERFPLTRRAFTTQLKAHGCRADHTRTARIWRGIRIVTADDGG